MSALPVSLRLGSVPGDPDADNAREAFRKLLLGVNELTARVEGVLQSQAWTLPVTNRSLVVQPRIPASRPADGVFQNIDHANGWNIGNPPVGPYQPTLYELQPAFYGQSQIICIPGGIYVGRARETTTFEDGPGRPTIVLSNGCVVDNITIWGSNNPTTFSIEGTNTRSAYVRADLLSAIPPGGGPVEPGARKSRGYRITGDFAGVFFDGVWDLDHSGSLPGCVLDGVGQEADFHHGFRERYFIDMFHAQDAFIHDYNRVQGIYFWQSTVRGVRGFRAETGGQNVSPLRLRHLMPDGVTLAPGSSFVLHDGGDWSGAPIHLGERCSLIVSAGASWPGLSADSRGSVFVMDGDYPQTRVGPARFAWVVPSTAAVDLTNLEDRAGRISLFVPGRGATNRLDLFEDQIGTLGSGTWMVKLGLTLTSPFAKPGHRQGLYLRNSANTGYVFFGIRDGGRVVVEHAAAHDAAPGAPLVSVPVTGTHFALRVAMIGGTRFYSIASGGRTLTDVFQEANTAHRTPNRCGVALDARNDAAPDVNCSLSIDDWFLGV